MVKCEICGDEFRPRNPLHTTCTKHECKAAKYGQKKADKLARLVRARARRVQGVWERAKKRLKSAHEANNQAERIAADFYRWGYRVRGGKIVKVKGLRNDRG